MDTTERSTASLGPVKLTGANITALVAGAALAGAMTWGLLRFAHPIAAVVAFLILLVLPFHAYGETHSRRWSFFTGLVIGSITSLLMPLDRANLDLLPENARSGLAMAVSLFVPSFVSTFIAGQIVAEPKYPPVREALRDWSAQIGFWIALVTMVLFFTSGLETARTVGSRLTTSFVSTGLLIFLGYRAGIWCADFVLERRTVPVTADAACKLSGAQA